MIIEEQYIYDEQRKRKWDNEAVKEQQRLDFEAVKEQQRLDFEAVQEQQRLDFEEEKERSRIDAKIEERKLLGLEMKKEGYTIDQIVKITKLTVEEINAL